MPASKLLVLQQNDCGPAGAASYMTGQENGGKIVLVTTEQMSIDQTSDASTVATNNGNDEELTSLTWLHDKNLLKGKPADGTRSSATKSIAFLSGINLSCSSAAKQAKAAGESPVGRQPASGTITPTSDYLDDSGVSEENVSSTNSSTAAEPGVSVYGGGADTSPRSYHYAQAAIVNNNNSNSKNRNVPNQHQPPPAASVVHLSPGGSTVIEYKTASSLQQKLAASPSGAVADSADPKSISATPHTHFHKKYLKQMQLNGLNVIATAASSETPATIQTVTVSSCQTTKTYTIPLNPEYASPIRYSVDHESVIVENDYQPAHIATVSTTNGHHHDDFERHDDYVTPISSPQQQQNAFTPQKTAYVTNVLMSPSTASTPNSVQSSPTSMPPVSPTTAQNKQKHPNNLPYDPFIHTNNKPPLSFSSLIFLAIEDAKEKALPVKEIYSWIVQHYPYFKTAPTGWKNSVRHNLSLNKCFQKVEKAPVSLNTISFPPQNAL